MSNLSHSLYITKRNRRSKDNLNQSDSSATNNRRLGSYHGIASNYNESSSSIINDSHSRALSNNALTVFKAQDAEDVVDWIDNIRARYENLKTKQRQELNELLQQKQDEDFKRKLKSDMQQRHFDEGFAKLGEILERREAENKIKREDTEALLQRRPLSESRNQLSAYSDQLPHWARQNQQVDVEENEEMEESEIDSMDQDEDDLSERYGWHGEERKNIEVTGVSKEDVIEILSSSEEEEEALNSEVYDPSHHSAYHIQHDEYRNDPELYTAQSALAYAQPMERRIDPHFARSGETQERYDEDYYLRAVHTEYGDYEEEEYNEEEDYNEEEYEEDYDDENNGYAYQPQDRGVYADTASHKDHTDPNADEDDEEEIDSMVEYDALQEGDEVDQSDEEIDSMGEYDALQEEEAHAVDDVELDVEREIRSVNDEPFPEQFQHQQRRSVNNESEYDELKSIIQGDEYERSSHMEMEQGDLLGESSVDSDIESLDYGGCTDANYSRQNSAPVSITAMPASPHPFSELENVASNVDSQAEGFADEEKEEDENDDSRNVPTSTYNTLMAFASRALGDRSLHKFKETHTQSGYMADAEYTDSNLPRISKDDDVDSDTQLQSKDFRQDEMAPVPDPFYAQELNDERMKVNDLDENRSEGSLADESQYESHRSDYHPDRVDHVQVEINHNSYGGNGPSQPEPTQVTEMPSALMDSQTAEPEYLSDECPPAPIFKSIEEEEDPETVLRNLKEAEKKYNIKIDAVEELENSIRSFSEPPNDTAKDTSFELSGNILETSDPDPQTEAAKYLQNIPVPVLESIDSASVSSSYGNNSSSVELDEMEVDERADDNVVEAISREESGVEDVNTDSYHDQPPQGSLSGGESVDNMKEDDAEAQSAKDGAVDITDANEDMNKEAIVSYEEGANDSASASPRRDIEAEIPASETLDVNDIDTPMLDSIYESSFLTNNESTTNTDERDENHGKRSSEDADEISSENGAPREQTRDVKETIQSRLERAGTYNFFDGEEEVPIISSGPDSEEEEVTVISSEEEVTNEEENLTVIQIDNGDGPLDVNGAGNVTNTGDLIDDDANLDDQEGLSGAELANSKAEESETDSHHPELSDSKQVVESTHLQREEEEPFLQQNYQGDVSQELVQDVIDLAYRMAENDQNDYNVLDDSFTGHAGEDQEEQIEFPKTEELVTSNRLQQSDIREKLLSIFPNVGPSISATVPQTLLSDTKSSSNTDEEENTGTGSPAEEEEGPEEVSKLNSSSLNEIVELDNGSDLQPLSSRFSAETVNRFLGKVLRGDYFKTGQVTEGASKNIEDGKKQDLSDDSSSSDGLDSDSNGNDTSQEVTGLGSGSESDKERDTSSLPVLQGDQQCNLAKNEMETLANAVSNFIEEMDEGESGTSSASDGTESLKERSPHPNIVHDVVDAAANFVEEMDEGESGTSCESDNTETSKERSPHSNIAHDLADAAANFVAEMDEGESEVNAASDDTETSKDQSPHQNISQDVADAAANFVEEMDDGETSEVSSDEMQVENLQNRISESVRFSDFASRPLLSFSEAAKRFQEQVDKSSDDSSESDESFDVQITYIRPSSRRRKRRRTRRHNLPSTSMELPERKHEVTNLLVPELKPVVDESSESETSHPDDSMSNELVDAYQEHDMEEVGDASINTAPRRESLPAVQVKVETIITPNYEPLEVESEVSPSSESPVLQEQPSLKSLPEVSSASSESPVLQDEIQATLQSIAELESSTPTLKFIEPAPGSMHRRNPTKRKLRKRRRILGLDLSEIERFGSLDDFKEGSDDDSESRGRKRADPNELLQHLSTMGYPASRTRSKSPLKKKRKLE